MRTSTPAALALAGLLALAVTSCGGSGDDTPVTEKPAVLSAPGAGLGSIVPDGAALEKVTGGHQFDTAGSPLWMDGVLYCTNNNLEDPHQSATFRMAANGTLEPVRPDNGATTTLQMSGTGTIYGCEMIGSRVIEMDTDGAVVRVVVDSFDGKKLDEPNDICVDGRGGFYFTDSRFLATRPKNQDVPAVYYVRPDGAVVRVIDDVPFPNGIWLSPNGDVLYVCNTTGLYLRAYDVNPDGTTANGRDFAELELAPEVVAAGDEASGSDGICVDMEGNIYVATTKGLGIQVFDRDGTHLGNIPCPAATNNVNFGGPDMKTLYVSAKDGIYAISLKVAGSVPVLAAR